MGELMNQICALQHPLDSATETLDQQAKDERYQFIQFELHRQKTCPQCFRLGQTQTRLYRAQKMARDINFQIQEVDGLYFTM